MIYYDSGHHAYNLLQCHGSVFPKSLLVALPCGVIAGVLRWLFLVDIWNAVGDEDSVLTNQVVWSGFTFSAGFLIVFRTSEAYARFWDGCSQSYIMRARWFGACCSLVTFCKHSTASLEAQLRFQNVLIRLVSMLHAAALADMEDDSRERVESVAFGFELIDVEGVDVDSLEALKHSPVKAELLYAWIQQLVVENIATGVLSIPPPILASVFQDLADGMVACHEAKKISSVPFPFPYSQTCDCLLFIQWLAAPFVVAKWVPSPLWAAVFCFIQVFILWALNFIAVELENPFGQDANDLDGMGFQADMNLCLEMLLTPSVRRTPSLSDIAIRYDDRALFDTETSQESQETQIGSPVSAMMSDGSLSPSRRLSPSASGRHRHCGNVPKLRANRSSVSLTEVWNDLDKTRKRQSLLSPLDSHGSTSLSGSGHFSDADANGTDSPKRLAPPAAEAPRFATSLCPKVVPPDLCKPGFDRTEAELDEVASSPSSLPLSFSTPALGSRGAPSDVTAAHTPRICAGATTPRCGHARPPPFSPELPQRSIAKHEPCRTPRSNTFESSGTELAQRSCV